MDIRFLTLNNVSSKITQADKLQFLRIEFIYVIVFFFPLVYTLIFSFKDFKQISSLLLFNLSTNKSVKCLNLVIMSRTLLNFPDCAKNYSLILKSLPSYFMSNSRHIVCLSQKRSIWLHFNRFTFADLMSKIMSPIVKSVIRKTFVT